MAPPFEAAAAAAAAMGAALDAVPAAPQAGGERGRSPSETVDAAAAAKTGRGKKTVNVGKQGGSAGLDDYIFDEALDDEVDFM